MQVILLQARNFPKANPLGMAEENIKIHTPNNLKGLCSRLENIPKNALLSQYVTGNGSNNQSNQGAFRRV